MAAVMLLVGCTGTESSDVQTTSAAQTTQKSTVTSTAVSSTQQGSGSAEEQPEEAISGGISLSSEHGELRSVFRNADEYCDYEDMGLYLTHCTDVKQKAFALLENESDYSTYRFGDIIGIGADDGCFYFSLIAEDETYTSWTRFYFCCNCDTGEVMRIYPPEGYSKIVGISSEIVVAGNDGRYAAVRRDSGFTQPLSDTAQDIVVVDNMVFYQRLKYPTVNENGEVLITTNWYTVWEKSAMKGETELFDQYAPAYDFEGIPVYYSNHELRRGINNIVCYSADYGSVVTLGGQSFITHDTRQRIRDMVYDTYYAGTLMCEKNMLGYRTRFSVTDADGNERVLGIMQTENDDTYHAAFSATKDGVIYLQACGKAFVMLGRLNKSGYLDSTQNIAVAFAPEELSGDFQYIRCDNQRLYFFNDYDDVLVSLCREQ